MNEELVQSVGNVENFLVRENKEGIFGASKICNLNGGFGSYPRRVGIKWVIINK